MFSDASNTGWGSVIYNSDNTLEVSGAWNPGDSGLHIYAKEMLTIQYNILSFSDVLKNKVVQFMLTLLLWLLTSDL